MKPINKKIPMSVHFIASDVQPSANILKIQWRNRIQVLNPQKEAFYCLICDNAASIMKASDFALSDFQEQHNKYWKWDWKWWWYWWRNVWVMRTIFPKHSRCHAHSFQLVVKYWIGDCSQSLKSIVAKASNIVSF